MQPRSFAGQLRMASMELRTSSISSSTSLGQLLAKSCLAGTRHPHRDSAAERKPVACLRVGAAEQHTPAIQGRVYGIQDIPRIGRKVITPRHITAQAFLGVHMYRILQGLRNAIALNGY